MSEHPRIRRKDPERSAPIRDWSNMFRSSGAQSASAPSADLAAAGLNDSTPGGLAGGSAPMSIPAAAVATVSEEARIGIETDGIC